MKESHIGFQGNCFLFFKENRGGKKPEGELLGAKTPRVEKAVVEKTRLKKT